MAFGIARSPSLGIQPRCRVWIRWVDGLPKILAGGVPVIPFNTALRHRARNDGATRKSLAAYARAGALYTTYCAHQGVGLLDIANDEFPSFVDGLTETSAPPELSGSQLGQALRPVLLRGR